MKHKCVKATLLEKNTTFDYNVFNFSVNVTTFGMLIDNVGIDELHELGC